MHGLQPLCHRATPRDWRSVKTILHVAVISTPAAVTPLDAQLTSRRRILGVMSPACRTISKLICGGFTSADQRPWGDYDGLDAEKPHCGWSRPSKPSGHGQPHAAGHGWTPVDRNKDQCALSLSLSLSLSLLWCMSWRFGVMVTLWSPSTRLTYAEPG